jgi:hypothetical protein
MNPTSPRVGAAGRGVEWFLEGLPAVGPSPEHQKQLMLFGQFVGDWEIVECRYLTPQEKWGVSHGELHWRWILEGRAVQDVWRTYDEGSKRMVPEGTTVRFYDPSIDAWHSVWFAPKQGAVRVFVGRPVGEEIMLESQDAEGSRIRWIFSEIATHSFRWRGEEFDPESSSWSLYEEMRIRRKVVEDGPPVR